MAMPSTGSSSIAPDLDALELTLVRSIENIRKTLPQNRRQSQDLPTIYFSLDQNLDTANNIALSRAEKRRGSMVSAENSRSVGDSRRNDDPLAAAEGSSWKKYIRESEALALENQMESVRQDMRELAGARQRRYQELTGHGDSTRRKLRRVSEALPQNRASNLVSRSNSEGSRGVVFTNLFNPLNGPAVGRKSRVLDGKDPEVGPMESDSMITYNNPFKGSSPSRLPRMRSPGKITKPILPSTSEICDLPPRHHRPGPTTHTRPLSTPVPVTSNVEIARPKRADFGQKIRRKAENPADSSRNGQTRHSSGGSGAGRKPQNFGEKKVRFAEWPVGIEKGTLTGPYGRKSNLINNSSSSSLSSWPSRSLSSRSLSLRSLSSQSLSITTSTSSDRDTSGSSSFSSSDNNTSESELHSLSSSGDEEPRDITALKPLRTPLGPLDQTGKRIPPGASTTLRNPRKGSNVIREVKERGKDKSGGLAHPLPTSSKAKKATPKENHLPGDVLGKTSEGLGKSPGPKVYGLTPASNHSPSQYANPHQFNLKKSTKTSIRSLLRKHSGNLLGKFSWRGNKAGLPKPPTEIREELACVGCRELFDANLLIQVPAKCLHPYCKPCLKAMFTQTLKDPRSAYPVQCCESNIIDVSLATDLLSPKKIARYKALLAESSDRTR